MSVPIYKCCMNTACVISMGRTCGVKYHWTILHFSSQEWKPSPTSKFITELRKCFCPSMCVLKRIFWWKETSLDTCSELCTILRIKDERRSLVFIKPQPPQAASFSFMAFSNSLYKTCKFFKAWTRETLQEVLAFCVLRSAKLFLLHLNVGVITMRSMMKSFDCIRIFLASFNTQSC